MSNKLPDSISITWTIDDVKEVDADRCDPSGEDPLTDDECRKVLWLADQNHDANIGINWDVLEVWIDQLRAERATPQA